MRLWFIKMFMVLLPLVSGQALAQLVEEEFNAPLSTPHSYLPSLDFDKKQPGPFQLSIEQRSYSDGHQALHSHRAYLQQEQLRMTRGQGQWTPPSAPMLSPADDDENDSFYDQTLFQLMYRFSFD